MINIDTIHAKAYFNLIKTSGWIEQEVKKALKPFGLTHAQLNILYILYKNNPQPVSPNNVKEQLLDSSPDLTRLFDRLVKKDWVTRETCPSNRRKIDISLTDEGKETFIKAEKAARQAVGNFFEDKITETEAAELRKILHKIQQ